MKLKSLLVFIFFIFLSFTSAKGQTNYKLNEEYPDTVNVGDTFTVTYSLELSISNPKASNSYTDIQFSLDDIEPSAKCIYQTTQQSSESRVVNHKLIMKVVLQQTVIFKALKPGYWDIPGYTFITCLGECRNEKPGGQIKFTEQINQEP